MGRVSSAPLPQLHAASMHAAASCCAVSSIIVLGAEVMRSAGKAMTVDELVRAIKPRGRAAVPDNIKAELLAKLRAHIVS